MPKEKWLAKLLCPEQLKISFCLLAYSPTFIMPGPENRTLFSSKKINFGAAQITFS